MKYKFIIIALILFMITNVSISEANKSQKVFNKLDKQEQLSMLRDMRKEEMSQINSQIKDVKSRIKTVETNTQMSMNKRQSALLELNRELTLLTDRKSELEKKYKIKINSIKKGK